MNTLTDPVTSMPDVQSSADNRKIAIQRVGVRGVRHPMLVKAGSGQAMPTVATWEMTVALPPEEKGTHMSRFVALLEQFRSQAITPAAFCTMATEMLTLLNARKGDIEASFPYFIEKTAPVSGVSSLMDYQLTWRAVADTTSSQSKVSFEFEVLVPVTSLCPCSKAISEYGAHNQRSHVTVTVGVSRVDTLDIDALVQTIEQQASCELWGLLKRPDEKFVTERAYENPKFVEDLVRDVADQLGSMPDITHYRVVAENFESIHNHSAYAVIEG
jgi:GTP cyclohydrolase I